jgi:hypothetical protein
MNRRNKIKRRKRIKVISGIKEFLINPPPEALLKFYESVLLARSKDSDS